MRKAAIVSPQNQNVIKLTYKGVEYRWTPHAGFIRPGGMGAPAALRPILESMIESRLKAEDDAITDPAVLGERAELARRIKQLNRAERLARRALDLSGEDMPDVSATLGAVLCEKNEPLLALEEVEPFADLDNAAIQQVLTIANDDLQRLSKAKAADWRATEILVRSGNDPWPEFQALAEKYDKTDKSVG